ncbi:MAG: alpha-2-macroglobulin family protein, partial [Planctomycetota bacterium]
PEARELELVLSHVRSDTDGNTSTIEVQRIPCSTSEEGEALVPITPEEGGNYVIRIEGMDRFGHPVQRTLNLYVSGEEDSQALRILTDVASLEPGAQADVQIVYRGEPRLSLLTFETDRIASARIVRLARGVNRYSFECERSWAPGFRLRVAVRGEAKLHQATAQFSCENKLDVRWTLAEDWQPGETTQLQLEVTDGLGRPVEADLALAIVDAALFDEAPDRSRSLSRTFRASRTEPIPVLTTASCRNNPRGVTHKVDAAVLAEEQRKEVEQQRAAARGQVLAGLEGLGYTSRGPGDMVPPAPDADFELDAIAAATSIGIGGGAGGSFGGRGGGRKQLRNGGNSAADEETLLAENNPTALWVGSVLTDKAGRATVEFTVPVHSARWRLSARGAGKDALFGEATTSRNTVRDFSVELVRLNPLLEGDRPRFVARVFDAARQAGACTLRLSFPGSDLAPQELAVTLDGSARSDFLFEATPQLPASELLTVQLRGERESGEQATDTHKIEVRPYGLERVDGESGLLTSNRQVRLKLDGSGRMNHRRLELELHSGVPRWLIESALQLAESSPSTLRHGSAGATRIATDLLGLLEVRRDLLDSSADPVEAQVLYAKGQDLLRRLVNADDPE